MALAHQTGAINILNLWYVPNPHNNTLLRQFANTINDLVVMKGYDRIKYVSVQNEVNGQKKLTMEEFKQWWVWLDEELNALQIRDKVVFVCGDLVQENQMKWIEFMARNMSDICQVNAYDGDGNDVHENSDDSQVVIDLTSIINHNNHDPAITIQFTMTMAITTMIITITISPSPSLSITITHGHGSSYGS